MKHICSYHARAARRVAKGGVLLLLSLPIISASSQSAWDSPPSPPTLTLTPAVALAKVRPGEGWTQTLHMSNMTPASLRFDVDVEDVAVENGQRVYVPAGETQSGIAATAVVSPRSLTIGPQSQGSVTVTVTIPQTTALRAVVVYFRSRPGRPEDSGTVALGASLGALLTFDLSGDYSFKAVGFSATTQTDATNQVVSHELLNSGPEVVIPKGATTILDESGHSVAKTTFPSHRLLPGESSTFSAICPMQLKPGRYREISSFEFDRQVITASGEFSVP